NADDHSDRLTDGHGGRIRQVSGNDFTDQPIGLRGGFAQNSDGVNAIEHAPAEGLAGFSRGDFRDLGHAALENIGGFQEQVAAHARWRRAPGRKRSGSSLDGPARIFPLSRGNLRSYTAGERVLLLVRLAVERAGPFSVDEQLFVANRNNVHGNLPASNSSSELCRAQDSTFSCRASLRATKADPARAR